MKQEIPLLQLPLKKKMFLTDCGYGFCRSSCIFLKPFLGIYYTVQQHISLFYFLGLLSFIHLADLFSPKYSVLCDTGNICKRAGYFALISVRLNFILNQGPYSPYLKF